VVGQAAVAYTRFGGRLPLDAALGVGFNALFGNVMVMLFVFLAVIVAVNRIR
jgi:hypothetical protein